jgi:hypothetical protein
VPLVEANEQKTYFTSGMVSGADEVLNIGGRQIAWKFIPVEAKGYYIQDDSTGIRITEGDNYAIMTADPTVSPDLQIFRVVPSPGNPNLVAFQSYASGKFIQVNYCYFQGQTAGYVLPIIDSSSCGVYGLVTQSNVSDTCYCVNQYVLEK